MRGSSDGGRHRGRSVRKNQVAIGRADFSELKRIWLMLVVFAPLSPLGVVRISGRPKRMLPCLLVERFWSHVNAVRPNDGRGLRIDANLSKVGWIAERPKPRSTG